MSKGINCAPHTALEPLERNEMIVIGGDSWGYPQENADALIMDTVRDEIFIIDNLVLFRPLVLHQNWRLTEHHCHQQVKCKFNTTKIKTKVLTEIY